MEKKADLLLKEILEFTQYPYLSDLHAAGFDERAKVLISQIPESHYDISDWNEVVFYITGRQYQCQSIGEAKEKLHD